MPNRIGKYEITAEIGRGGFSRVYRGFDPNVNRPVAIKVSTRESDPEHLSRFRNEASAAGNLRHENIVTIHDYGDDDGVPYLVMELLDGRDLHHIMREGPKLSLLEKMQTMSQVAEGLRCAHQNGVVHRDIKPANIMLLTDGTVKILDFGIARMTGEISRVTQSGYLVGTPLYMSPEQLQGGDADALCDVWAYGVLYFELLTGQHPFLSQDNTRLIRNITIVNPPSIHSLTRGVPEGLAQVIRRALTKDRRRRYQSLDEILVDTNPILAMLQHEQTAGLVTEAQYFRNSGQLAAARQSSRRALEIDPGNLGAQQLLKSIQHDLHAERFTAPDAAPVVVAPAPPPPVVAAPRPEYAAPRAEYAAPRPAPKPAAAPARAARPLPVFPQDEPEMILPDEPAPAAPAAPAAIFLPPAPTAPAPVAVAAPVARVLAAAAPPPAPVAAAVETPPSSSPTTQQKLRPALAGGAAAAIAAAVAAAKARQAQEERRQVELEPEEEEEPITSSFKVTPLVVSALPTTRVAPMASAGASLKRAENGSGVFLTDDPLVVKRPAAAVLTQRLSSAAASAAVATPAPPAPPPTRLAGAKAIPSTVARGADADDAIEVKAAPAAAPSKTEGREGRPQADNVPMRRPPSEVYSKGKRRRSSSSSSSSSSTLFAEKQKPRKPFPWMIVGFVTLVIAAAAALVIFSVSAPKYVKTPVLMPDKMAFSWKPGAPVPAEQLLTLKGGTAASSFAAASDQDWLVVTPEIDEANNRNWQVKVDPDKLGVTTPNTYTGWIDVTSTEGFKTQAEVSFKIGAGETTPEPAPGAKGKKTPVFAPKEEKPVITPVAPAVVTTPTPAAKKPALPPSAGDAAARTAAVKPAPTPLPKTTSKKPVSDGIDINDQD